MGGLPNLQKEPTRRLVKPPGVKFNAKIIHIVDRLVAVCPTWYSRKASIPMEMYLLDPALVG
jgi:hypothetical protein